MSKPSSSDLKICENAEENNKESPDISSADEYQTVPATEDKKNCSIDVEAEKDGGSTVPSDSDAKDNVDPLIKKKASSKYNSAEKKNGHTDVSDDHVEVSLNGKEINENDFHTNSEANDSLSPLPRSTEDNVNLGAAIEGLIEEYLNGNPDSLEDELIRDFFCPKNEYCTVPVDENRKEESDINNSSSALLEKEDNIIPPASEKENSNTSSPRKDSTPEYQLPEVVLANKNKDNKFPSAETENGIIVPSAKNQDSIIIALVEIVVSSVTEEVDKKHRKDPSNGKAKHAKRSPEKKHSGREIDKEIGEFVKEYAAKWNAMNEEQKEYFLESAGINREQYNREMSIGKSARNVNKPKRPKTAFGIFMSDFKKEMAGKEPEGGVAAMTKLGRKRWKRMTDEDKQPYVEQHLEARSRYEHSKEEYRRMVYPSPKEEKSISEELNENDERFYETWNDIKRRVTEEIERVSTHLEN